MSSECEYTFQQSVIRLKESIDMDLRPYKKTGLDRINSPLLCCPPNNRRELNMSIQPPTREVALFYGPQLLGCVFGIAFVPTSRPYHRLSCSPRLSLSVIVHLQTLLYFQRYPSDQRNIKLLVSTVNHCLSSFRSPSLQVIAVWFVLAFDRI
jgi:hypothetical protein